AMSRLRQTGGASGPLYGSALIEIAKQSKADTDNVSKILAAGLQGIQKRGKAEPGEKTMVDVWVPIIEAVENNSLTQEMIQQAVEGTKPLQATKGRASYRSAE